ncbi:hypothetical protein HDV00_005115 [Rhizophlyctis rosea]|nr:hypothetical protein HDV00_005115 [Rhizophlyctis rosea]
MHVSGTGGCGAESCVITSQESMYNATFEILNLNMTRFMACDETFSGTCITPFLPRDAGFAEIKEEDDGLWQTFGVKGLKGVVHRRLCVLGTQQDGVVPTLNSTWFGNTDQFSANIAISTAPPDIIHRLRAFIKRGSMLYTLDCTITFTDGMADFSWIQESHGLFAMPAKNITTSNAYKLIDSDTFLNATEAIRIFEIPVVNTIARTHISKMDDSTREYWVNRWADAYASMVAIRSSRKVNATYVTRTFDQGDMMIGWYSLRYEKLYFTDTGTKAICGIVAVLILVNTLMVFFCKPKYTGEPHQLLALSQDVIYTMPGADKPSWDHYPTVRQADHRNGEVRLKLDKHRKAIYIVMEGQPPTDRVVEEHELECYGLVAIGDRGVRQRWKGAQGTINASFDREECHLM